MSLFKQDPCAILSARHWSCNEAGRPDGKNRNWWTGTSNEQNRPLPCIVHPALYHCLRRNTILAIIYITFENDLALRVGPSSTSGLKPSFKAAVAHKYWCNLGYLCGLVTVGSGYYSTQPCPLKWEICYYWPSQVSSCDPNSLKGHPQSI